MVDIGGSRIFLGGIKDEFIRMCTDCIAVKTQLLRYRFLTNTAKSHTHHFPGLLGRFPSKKNSEIILKLI